MKKEIKRFIQTAILLLVLGVILVCPARKAGTYGEVPDAAPSSPTDSVSLRIDYNNWLNQWRKDGADDSGKILLTPGSTPADLQFSWYSENVAAPAVALSKTADFAGARVFTGNAIKINRTNGIVTYRAANHVSVKNFFEENTTYYYRYTDDCRSSSIGWSDTFSYRTGSASSFSAILIGDAQIGASGNIAADAYNFSRTLAQAAKTAPDAAFLLSAGDQIDYKENSGDDGLRESQYAGFLYSPLLRQLPVAAAIGNHETKGKDYKYHFNNPNTEKNYGATSSGCDYYFCRGNALFIVLNSNNRKVSAHRKLIRRAIKKAPAAKWRIVMFHHDIYGSGIIHSNRTAANMRILFAPLMDEFSIDLVLSGHDHSYARSYPMLDGTAVTGSGTVERDRTVLKNPIGTTYLSLGTSSGSKMYGLASPRQFYVAERSNDPVPTFSTLTVSGDTLTVKTYDYEGNRYADDFSIRKTAKKTNPAARAKKMKALKKSSYTKASYKRLARSLKTFRRRFQPTAADRGAARAARLFQKKNDPLSYYGYAAGTTSALPNGFSTLLDKTRRQHVRISRSKLMALDKKIRRAFKKLKHRK